MRRLPEDTNAITSLTVKQAKTLVATADRGSLELNGLTKLSPQVAATLATFYGPLKLCGLNAITKRVAEALCNQEWSLRLDGLTTLSPEVAAALAKHHGELYLDGLTTLSAEVAAVLRNHDGSVSLNGLTTLSREAAAALATCNNSLHLNGLTALSPELAAALAKNCVELSLNGLTTLSPAAAVALARFNPISEDEGDYCVLQLDGLTTLSTEAAAALGECMAMISLDGLTSLTAEAAAALAKHEWARPYAARFMSLPESIDVSPECQPSGQADCRKAGEADKIPDAAMAASAKHTSTKSGPLLSEGQQEVLGAMGVYAAAGALLFGPIGLIAAPLGILGFELLKKIPTSGSGSRDWPIGPDGEPTPLRCAWCGSGVCADRRICASCHRPWFGK